MQYVFNTGTCVIVVPVVPDENKPHSMFLSLSLFNAKNIKFNLKDIHVYRLLSLYCDTCESSDQ